MGINEETEIVIQGSRMESASIFLLRFDQDLKNTWDGIHIVGWVEGRNPTYRRRVSTQPTKLLEVASLGFIEQLLSMLHSPSMFKMS